MFLAALATVSSLVLPTFGLTGQAFDAITTGQAIKRGCVESNSAIHGSHPTTTRVAVTKTAIIAPTALAAYILQKKGHDRIANSLWLGMGTVGWTSAAVNSSCK